METKCQAEGCDMDARCAIKTARPTRGDLQSTLYCDDRSAPKTATRYCKKHGTEVITGMMLFVDGDNEVGGVKENEAKP